LWVQKYNLFLFPQCFFFKKFCYLFQIAVNQFIAL